MVNLKFWQKKDKGFGLDEDFPSSRDIAAPHDLGLPLGDLGFQGPMDSNIGKGFDQQHIPGQFTSPPDFGQQQVQQRQNTFQQQPIHPEQHQGNNRDLDLVLAKLDAIKSELNAINQRLLRLEIVSEQKQEPSQYSIRKYAREY